MNPFVSIPCQRCGAAVWVATSTGIGQCQQCQTPAQMTQASPYPGYAPQGYPSFGGQTSPALPAPSRRGLKVVVALLGVIMLVCSLGVGFALIGQQNRTMSGMGIDVRAADPDAMIRRAGEFAREWRSDAVLHEVFIEGMRANGTIDLSQSTHLMYVEYVSPSEEHEAESGKRFTFTSAGLRDEVRAPEEGRVAVPLPTCTAQRLGAVLPSHGVAPTEELAVSYGTSPNNPNAHWIVDSETNLGVPYGQFDANTCAPVAVR